MRSLLTVVFVASFVCQIFSQTSQIYDPNADAQKEIKEAVKKASASGKHVFLQIGGNWCSWCIKFHKFVEADKDIKSFVEANYEVVKVNYDSKNRQGKLMTELGYPQRFGFPVFVILDKNGKRIHTQNSAFLEKDSSYDRKRVMSFFQNWSAKSIDPVTYEKRN